RAGSRADDSAPEMSLENALKILGLSEGASFEEIVRAKNSIVASLKDDQRAISQAEAAYDMLLMQSLSRRRSGKVVNSGIRYADVKPVEKPSGKLKWVSVEAPTSSEVGLHGGVYGALIVLTYLNGAFSSASADVPGLILAVSFGASMYLMTKRNVRLGKATVITIGGLVAGAAIGSAVESWLQVDIVPFMGVHSPAAVVAEFIIFSQFIASLWLR
ncbi:hypothetical protein M569_03498, partial [Genlisea aurea]